MVSGSSLGKTEILFGEIAFGLVIRIRIIDVGSQTMLAGSHVTSVEIVKGSNLRVVILFPDTIYLRENKFTEKITCCGIAVSLFKILNTMNYE